MLYDFLFQPSFSTEYEPTPTPYPTFSIIFRLLEELNGWTFCIYLPKFLFLSSVIKLEE